MRFRLHPFPPAVETFALSTPAQKRDSRRAQLLEAALSLFSEKGYYATSIADIIERAQVARGTFYNYFDGKRQIFNQLLDQLFEAVTVVIFPITAETPSEVQAQVWGNIEALIGNI